jgi:exodeoxyribonuclease V alpha subunit
MNDRPVVPPGIPGPDEAADAAREDSGPGDALSEGFARRIARLAIQAGARGDSVRAVRAAALAVSRATADGHVCIALDDVAVAAGLSVAALRAALVRTPLTCDGTAADNRLSPLVLDAHGRLYLARYYAHERSVGAALARLARSAPGAALSDAATLARRSARLARFFGGARAGVSGASAPFADAAEEVDWQRVAAALALDNRLTVISGGPGTGKTSTVVGILACLLDDNPTLTVALAAPTGKAAQRMQEALLARAAHLPPALAARLPATSYTLHRLLGLAGARVRHHRVAPLPYDVVVVDEASMIDVALAARLINALHPDARLILLGDKDQLAAVEAGAVFAELSARPSLSAPRRVALAAMLGIDASALGSLGANDADARATLSDCVVWLQRNYRFGLESAIGRLSLAIRAGDAAQASTALLAGEGGIGIVEDVRPRPEAATLARLGAGFDAYARALTAYLERLRQVVRGEARKEDGSRDPSPMFDALDSYRVLCAVRSGARGTIEINAAIAASVRQRCGLSIPLGAQWFAGRPVMVTRNDYALGLFNGDTGIALPDGAGALRVVFRNARGYRAVSPAALPPHETAFALTVHKSQGSEFDRVALVLPAGASRVLSRELVYTAVTRARHQVEIYGSATVFAQAVATPTRRVSGLLARLEEALRDGAAGG